MTDADMHLKEVARATAAVLVRERRRFELGVLGWLLAVTAGLTIALYVGFNDAAKEHHRDTAAATQAQILCTRSRLFTPALGAYFARVHALNREELAAYEALLPRSC